MSCDTERDILSSLCILSFFVLFRSILITLLWNIVITRLGKTLPTFRFLPLRKQTCDESRSVMLTKMISLYYNKSQTQRINTQSGQNVKLVDAYADCTYNYQCPLKIYYHSYVRKCPWFTCWHLDSSIWNRKFSGWNGRVYLRPRKTWHLPQYTESTDTNSKNEEMETGSKLLAG